MPESCENCKFVYVLPIGGRVCRRFPPSASGMLSSQGFPKTDATGWCGEWAIRNATAAAEPGAPRAAAQERPASAGAASSHFGKGGGVAKSR